MLARLVAANAPGAETEERNLARWAAKHLRHRLTTYDPNSPTLGLSPFQRELGGRLDWKTRNRGTKTCRMAPRKNSKSTYSTIAYPLREALEGREPYVLILSDALEKNAIPFLRDNIKREIEDNKSLQAEYPGACSPGRIWQDDKIELANGACIEVSSTGQNIRGRLHNGNPPSLVIGDDLQSKADVMSPTLRKRAWGWFNEDVLNIGNPGTNFLVVGTAIHKESIVYRLWDNGAWDTKVWRAIGGEQSRNDDRFVWAEHLKHPELWDQWERVLHDGEPGALERARQHYDDHRGLMDDDLADFVLWPEQYPLYDLMLKLTTIGPTAFAFEEQNNPTDPSLNEFLEEWFDDKTRPEFWFDAWPEDLVLRTLGLDPAKGRKNKPGDYACFVLHGVNRAGREHVKADLFRGSQESTLDSIIRKAVQYVREFRPEVLAVEAIGFQHLYGRLLRQALDAAGLEVHIELVEDMADKDVRIRRLTTPLAQRKLRFFRDRGTSILVEQLRDFGPAAERKDGPDCLEATRRTAFKWLTGQIRRRDGGRGPEGYTT